MENEKKRSGWRTAGIDCRGWLPLDHCGHRRWRDHRVDVCAGHACESGRSRSETRGEAHRASVHPLTNTTKTSGAPGADRSVLRLTLDLREGDFTIQPGAPGNDVQVRGEFAPGLYELVETQDTDAATGVRRATVRFRSKAPAWARFFAGIGGGDNEPSAPHGDHSARLADRPQSADGHGAVGGRSRRTDAGRSQRQHHDGRAPASISTNPWSRGCASCASTPAWGTLSLENLGNAHADTIHASGSMGNVTANLGGSWPAGATSSVTFEQSMGELTLRVPNSVRLDADVRSSQGGETKSRTTQDATASQRSKRAHAPSAGEQLDGRGARDPLLTQRACPP